ncbi:nodulation protein NfeD [candidate division KSB1 bacterium]|nr:nodulation protein NfeD [candidate division KSB1 bacterium]
MKNILFILLTSCCMAAPPQVLKIVIDGDINPVSADFIIENIQLAEQEDYQCLLIQMDTPGGLLESTKTIVKGILGAQVPVVMYVAPSGSGAVSAGVFITLSCHIAAMADGTNIGAAHPVSVGQQDTSKVMAEKITNYASAWMRSIADKRGRNVAWAEQAVRSSVSVTEKEALKLNVIDMICPTQDSLLSAIHGRVFELEGGEKKLITRDALVIERVMNWKQKILYKISNPNIAYILMMFGIFGLIFELSNPGSIFPGVMGAICLVLAFFALQTLPVRTAGIILILFSILLFIMEVKVTSYGILTIGGIVSLFLGSIMLFEDTPGFEFKVDWRLALTVTITVSIFIIFALAMALKTRLTKPTTGKEGLVGEIGTTVTPLTPQGQVKIHGEIWQAICNEKININEAIIVNKVNGLLLYVKKLNNKEE